MGIFRCTCIHFQGYPSLIFSTSVGEDDDFFEAKQPKKSSKAAAPAPRTATPPPESDDLFSSDPLFGGEASKPSASPTCKIEKRKNEQPTKKPPPSDDLFASSPEPAGDEDELFSSRNQPPTKASPQVSKAKTSPPLKKQPSPKAAPKKKTTTGGLFGGSDDSDDDLFSDPKPKKVTQPKPATKPAGKGKEDLFSDDPFDSSSSKSKFKAEASKQAKPPDDLFTDPLATSPPPETKAKPVKLAKPVEDNLFSDPLATSPPPTQARPKPATKVAKPSTDSDDLFSDPLSGAPPPTRAKPKPQDDDLFSDEPLPAAPRTQTKPKAVTKPPDDLFDDPLATTPPASAPETKPKPATRAGSHDLFSDDVEAEPEPVAPPKKKLAGAVSMFGGIDPFAAGGGIGKGKVGGKGKSHDQEKPRLSTSPQSSEAEKKDNLFGKCCTVHVWVIHVYSFHWKSDRKCLITKSAIYDYIASSPGHSQLFVVSWEKLGVAWGRGYNCIGSEKVK